MQAFFNMQEEIQTLNIFDFLKNYWLILLFMGSLVMTWAQFESRVGNLEAEVSGLETQNAQIGTHLASIDVSIAQINTSLLYIKNNTQK